MEAIKLNLIPNGTSPVAHASQYDEGRSIRFDLFEGAAVYTLDGTEVLECDIKKPDGNIVTVAVANTSDSYIVVETTLQMCACAGNSFGEIKITKGAKVIGTLNFILAVERSPLEGGIASQSEINNLATQVAGLVATEVADQYDSANVIFDTDPTTGHGIGYAVTSEGVKNAIDAMTPAASAVSYDNTGSGMAANNVQDAIDETAADLSELIYSHGEYTYMEIILGKATASAGGLPRVFFFLPKMVKSTDTLTVDSVTITACRKYDGTSVPQTTATATYDATDNKIQIDGDAPVGAHNLIALQLSITFTIS